VVSLGRNWTQPWANESNAAICRQVGGYLAAGDIIGVLDDDNIWEPQHVAEMVACFEATGADVVFGDFFVPAGNVFACWPGNQPRVGNCDSSSYMYRWETLKRARWEADGYTCDGLLAERLLAAGCTWARKQGATMRMTSQRFGGPD
jgi:Glycosyl transferase family 2